MILQTILVTDNLYFRILKLDITVLFLKTGYKFESSVAFKFQCSFLNFRALSAPLNYEDYMRHPNFGDF